MNGQGAIAAVFLAAFPVSLAGAVYEVSHSPTNRTYASGDVIAAVTEPVPAVLPAVSSPPSFHFDATQTSSWTFGALGATVKRIPSLCGDRYLFSEAGLTFSELAGPWNGNNDTWTVAEPAFVASDPVLGMPCVDFGVAGSCRAMLFDNEHGEEGETVATNLLSGIGTVVAVWNSEDGGGQLFGGGMAMNGNSVNCGCLWSRGASGIATDNATSQIPYSYLYSTFDWSSPVAEYRDADVANIGSSGARGQNGAQLAWSSFVLGVVRHDGFDAVPWNTGFNGGWEVVSSSPLNAGGNAHGIGIGAVLQASDTSGLTGGMKIGEMIVYPEVLSVFDLAKVENYLQKKWFGRPERGTGGNAYLHGAFVPRTGTKDGSSTTFDVPAGESLTVGKVPFGRGKGAQIVKTGAGKLTLGDVRDYPGKVVVSDGTLALGSRALPRSLPGDPIFHIDASDAESMATTEANGTNFVDSIASVAKLSWREKKLCAAKDGSCKRPFLRSGMFPDVNGAPAPAIDFYPMPTQDGSSGMFNIAEATDTSSIVELSGVTTLAAVYAPRATGGTILGFKTASFAETGCYFDRGQAYDSWGNSTKPILGVSPYARIHPTLAPTNGMVMIDGVVRNPRDGFPRQGFQVVIIQVPGSYVNAIGSSYKPSMHWAGGFMLAELALWNRDLSLQEMEDATAYLSAKWFHKPPPGYGRGDGEMYDVQDLELTGDVSVEVPDGLSARVGKLTLSGGGSFVKTGGGTLEIVNVTTQKLADVRIKAGGIRYVGLPETKSATDYAKGASLHLDASDPNTVYRETPATDRVTYWFDRHHRNFCTASGNSPGYGTTGNQSPTGLPAVDFGQYRSKMRMDLADALDGVRSAYVVYCAVWHSNAKGGVLLGAKESSADRYFKDFYFHQSGGWPVGPVNPDAGQNYMCSDYGTVLYTNGVSVAVSAEPRYPTNGTEYVLYELHLPAGAHVSGLCELAGEGSPDNFTGGGRYGEIMLYERELTAREKVATRNYLMKKWLGTADEDLAPLPEAPQAQVSVDAINLRVDDGDSLEVLSGEPFSAAYLLGGGSVTKTGDGTLSVGDVVGFTGTVSVAEGLLRITSARPAVEPRLPAPSNRLVHVDASRGLYVANFAGDGSKSRVMGWENLADSGWSVTNNGQSAENHPYAYADETLGGRTVVKFDKDATTGLRFVSPEGVRTNMYGMMSGLFVLGAHEGGGFLLGGGETRDNRGVVTAKDCFHRGASGYGDNYTDKLLYSAACDAARTAEYWVNAGGYMCGENGSPAPRPTETNFYDDAWNSVAFRFAKEYGTLEAVGGFAYSNDHADRNGSQRLAEAVLYDRRLSDDELAAGQEYLRIKWGLDAFQRSMTNRMSVAVPAGAALDLGGAVQYLECVSGAGVVSNGTLSVSKLVADPLAGPLTLTGTFSASAGIEVDVSNLSSAAGGMVIPILECDSVDNAELLRSATFAWNPSWVGRYRARLLYEDGVVCVKFYPRGLGMVLR